MREQKIKRARPPQQRQVKQNLTPRLFLIPSLLVTVMFEQLLQKIDQLNQPAAETHSTPAIQPLIAGFLFPHLYQCHNSCTQIGSSMNTNGDSASNPCQRANGSSWKLGSDEIARWHVPVCATFVIVDV